MQGFYRATPKSVRMGNIEDSLKTLRALGDEEEWGDMPTPEFIAELVGHGSEIAPHLTAFLSPEALRERNASTNALDKIAWTAALALCDIGAPETAAAVVYAIFQANDEEMPEWAYKHFWSFGEAVIEPLFSVIQNRSLDWYFPAMAVAAMEIVLQEDASGLAQLAQILQGELEYYLGRHESGVVLSENECLLFASLANHLSEHRLPQMRPLLEASLETGEIDRFTFSQKALEEDYASTEPFKWIAERERFLDCYPKWHASNLLTEREEQARQMKAALAETKKLLAGRPAPPPSQKPGRNDACWCGSGKKYKKCHLEADQKR
jgi:hypothetical protein